MAKPARKTVEVGTLLHRVNYFLANDRSTADEREVMCTFIEGVLHDTGNYRGYRYLDTDQIEGNGSRRYYFVSGKIDEDYEAARALIQKHYYGRGV
jgi:hypothetical protein